MASELRWRTTEEPNEFLKLLKIKKHDIVRFAWSYLDDFQIGFHLGSSRGRRSNPLFPQGRIFARLMFKKVSDDIDAAPPHYGVTSNTFLIGWPGWASTASSSARCARS
jgi:hypothetical protein